jgi:hypothetical protein
VNLIFGSFDRLSFFYSKNSSPSPFSYKDKESRIRYIFAVKIIPFLDAYFKKNSVFSCILEKNSPSLIKRGG